MPLTCPLLPTSTSGECWVPGGPGGGEGGAAWARDAGRAQGRGQCRTAGRRPAASPAWQLCEALGARMSGAERREESWDRNAGRRGARLLACGLRARGSVQRVPPLRGAGCWDEGRGAAVGSRVCLRWRLLRLGWGVRRPAPRFWLEGRGQGLSLGHMVWLLCPCVRASACCCGLVPHEPSRGPPEVPPRPAGWLCAVRTKNRAPGGRLQGTPRGRLGWDPSPGLSRCICPQMHLSIQPAIWRPARSPERFVQRE